MDIRLSKQEKSCAMYYSQENSIDLNPADFPQIIAFLKECYNDASEQSSGIDIIDAGEGIEVCLYDLDFSLEGEDLDKGILCMYNAAVDGCKQLSNPVKEEIDRILEAIKP